MADKIVRTYQNVSNRAKARDPNERKIVYKSVLDNPFQVPWPKVPMNVQNAFLSRTISLLDGLAEIRHSRELSRLRVKKEAHAARISAMVAENAAHASSHTMLVDSQPEGAVPTAESSGEQDKDQETETSDGSPLHYMTIGTNAVTKKLETLSNRHRKALFPTESSADVSGKAPNPQLVLVCSADVNPPILISHIPSLIAACNTTRPRSDASAQTSVCWLVPLPLGSEAQLSQAIGLKRVSVIAIDSTFPNYSDFHQLLESVPVLTAPWLAPAARVQAPKLTQTHIKQIRTTAPKNMKVEKEKRAERIRASRERRRASKKEKESARKMHIEPASTAVAERAPTPFAALGLTEDVLHG